MSVKIKIKVGDLSLDGELYDTPSGRAILDILPLEADGLSWGTEIYFPIKLDLPLEEDAREKVKPGELGYWPPGKAFCLFFGSGEGDEEFQAASKVNIIGRIKGDPKVLAKVEIPAKIVISRA
ncbi:MAG: hypothetical protein J7L64_05640 [Acidobacteria bacterium]|nr:hypothetical protein [Acidobacteriota bacterium]